MKKWIKAAVLAAAIIFIAKKITCLKEKLPKIGRK